MALRRGDRQRRRALLAAVTTATVACGCGGGSSTSGAPAGSAMTAETPPSPIAPDVSMLDVSMVAASEPPLPLGEPLRLTISVVNRSTRSMAVPIELALRSLAEPDATGVPFHETQIFVGAGSESGEDVAVMPAQWYGDPGRFEVVASSGESALGEPLRFDVAEPAIVVPRFIDASATAGIETTVPEAECGQFSNGAAWEDIDGDDDLDLLVTRISEPMALFVNDGTGRFAEDAAARGLDVADANNVAFADYDNDGDADVIVVRDGSDLLFANDGRGRFTDVSATAGIGDDGRRGMNASWGDFDGDGFLDVYITNYMHCLGAWSTAEEVIAQVAYDTDTLYRNDGDGTFTDVTRYLEGDPTDHDDGTTIGAGFGASWFDYDGDGRLDLYLANDFVGPEPDHNRLWRNDGPAADGGWRFTDVSIDTKTALFMNTMGIGVGDVDRDGDFDLALTNITANKLLRNDGDAFTELTGTGIERPTQQAGYSSITWGAAFGDFNLDGWEDLYLSAGNLQQAPGVPTGVQPDELFLNDGSGEAFLDVSAATGADDPGEGKGAAVADYDRDGDLDIFVVNQNGSPRLLENVTPRGGERWLTVSLEGTASNRDGCGAIVRLELDSGTMQRMVMCGSGAGNSGGDRTAHFGLAIGESVGGLEILWPSGTRQQLAPPDLDQLLRVQEPSS